MIDSAKLLSHLQSKATSRGTMVRRLEDDLRKRCDQEPEVDAPLRAQYETAKAKKRTALTYKAWREEELTQIAVAWVLACVFVRFLEDNELIPVPKLAGPGARLQRARDEHELYFRRQPKDNTERGYLVEIFSEVGRLPGMKEFFDKKHNPLWLAAPSGDACRELWQFWQRTDPATGALVHDFTDPQWNTRFLGDLYQDLSDAARKRYALLQTPEFVEEFILDRTLTPAIETFGYREVRMIDPTCGSGHFLLGGFARLFKIWQDECPGENPRVLAQRALDAIHGVDLNPFAVAIARFRLLLAALRVCGVKRLKDAPDFQIHLATGDALLHGARFDSKGKPYVLERQDMFGVDEVFKDELAHFFDTEDSQALHRILGQQYHAVVGNPPYITVKDRAVSELYRARYPSCRGKYSLSVPFMERFFDLAVKGDGTPQQPAGFVGQITGNSFMKRGFGEKLIEEYLPRWDVTHVVDTDKAHIPGHATGTVILLGKNQPPLSSTIRTVMGLKKQEPKPEIAEQGLAWLAVLSQIDLAGSQSEWVSSADLPRANFHKHPWSIGGGGAAELKEQIEEEGDTTVGKTAGAMGVFGMTNADDVMLASDADFRRCGVAGEVFQRLVMGDLIRDWSVSESECVLFPYSRGSLRSLDQIPSLSRWLWTTRTTLGNRATFSKKTYFTEGRAWWAWHQVALERLEPISTITWGEIATHNHFVLQRGGVVFNQTAPLIKLKPSASEDEHTQLVGVLNSSTTCFFLKQICHDKGAGGIGGGIASEEWEHRFSYNSTPIAGTPLPTFKPSQLPTALVQTSTIVQAQSPTATLASWSGPESGELRTQLATARDQATRQMCSENLFQERAWPM